MKSGGSRKLLEGKSPTVRRAIYGFIDRYTIPPVMTTFDFADPNLHAPKRSETTVPQQALFFMNGPFVEARGKAVLEAVGEKRRGGEGEGALPAGAAAGAQCRRGAQRRRWGFSGERRR